MVPRSVCYVLQVYRQLECLGSLRTIKGINRMIYNCTLSSQVEEFGAID